MTKKRNPTDATLRNVRAANKQKAAIEARLDGLTDRVTALEQQMADPVTAIKTRAYANRSRRP